MGNLKENIYDGNAEQINKYIEIRSFINNLVKLVNLIIFFQSLKEYYVIPLSLNNLTDYAEQKINVKLEIPKNIELVLPSTSKLPDQSAYKDLTEGGVLYSILKLKLNEDVGLYNSSYYTECWSSPFKVQCGEQYIKNLNIAFENFLESLFNFKINNITDESIVIKYEFDLINPHENILFPSYLLIKSKKTINIKYCISSTNYFNSGELKYIVNE